MNSEIFEIEPENESAQEFHFHWPWGWGAMLAAGWLVFEITAQPRFAIAATCSKLVWNDCLTGLWLLRRDPWRQRGVCNLILLLIRATAKYAFVLIALGFVMIECAKHGLDIDQAAFEFTVGTGAIAVALWMFGGLFVSFLCVIGKVRLWIDSRMHEARERDVFPPTCHGWNQTVWLLMGSRLAEMVVIVCFCWAMSERFKLPAVIGITLMTVGPLLFLAVQIFVSRRIIARATEPCWRFPTAR